MLESICNMAEHVRQGAQHDDARLHYGWATLCHVGSTPNKSGLTALVPNKDL